MVAITLFCPILSNLSEVSVKNTCDINNKTILTKMLSVNEKTCESRSWGS